MKMPGLSGMKLLNIRQQWPKLGIQPAVMPQTEVRRDPGGLEIDQTAGRRALGIYPPIELGERLAELSRQAVLEGTARIAQEGDRYAAIHKGEDVTVELSFESMFRPKGVELDPPPSEPPRIRYTPDRLTFNWRLGEVAYRMEQDGKVTKLWLSDYDVNRDFNLEG